ncbi:MULTISPECIES: outer membrane protein assembly factor BamE [unclassified Ruegeria]|uniref:outer membrane protein assembly factor BamE n=1 Tax=unclassified Ruegeria TaxID=2625375 RepID=UPI0014877D0A|nr:outer membrane protein assembly factor BamE [Ruegeria sp. HKCCD8929]
MFKFIELLKPVVRITVFTVGVGAVTACTAIYRNHGYVPSEAELAEVKVGVDTRDSVIEAVGAPSSSGVLEESGYYYVASRIRHYGPKRPQVVSRELVAISFDQRGVVRNIERFGLEDGIVVPLERRVTSSSVEDKTFLRQLLGNIGNFNPAGFGNSPQ